MYIFNLVTYIRERCVVVIRGNDSDVTSLTFGQFRICDSGLLLSFPLANWQQVEYLPEILKKTDPSR